MLRLKTKPIILAVLTVLIILNLSFIWSHSLYSKTESSAQSGAVVEILTDILPILKNLPYETLDIGIRKLAHFSEFCSLGILTALLTYFLTEGTFRDFRYNCVVTSLLCLAAASTDEMLQIFSSRGNTISDVILDFFGSVFGIASVILILYLIKRNKSKKLNSPTAD